MFSSGSESLIHNDMLRILVELALLTFAFFWVLREGQVSLRAAGNVAELREVEIGGRDRDGSVSAP